MRLRTTAATILLVLIASCGQQPVPSNVPDSLEVIVSRAANGALEGRGRVLESRVLVLGSSAAKITLRLESSDREASLLVNRAVANALFDRVKYLEFDTRREPVGPLPEPLEFCAGSAIPTDFPAGPKPTSITGAKVVLNPGHGWTLRTNGVWGLQRGLVDTNGNPPIYVQEDFNNLLMAVRVRDALAGDGAVVSSARNLDTTAGNGVSGNPKWQEAAKHHLEALGLNPGLWNSERNSGGGDCNEEKDIRARPLYANALGADALIGLHSNAVGANVSTAPRGTRIYITNDHPLPNTPSTQEANSQALAQALQTSIVAAIRLARPDLQWPEAQVVKDGNYGETRYAKMAAVIVEVGFHTNPTDGPALGQDGFQRAVGDGIRAGLEAYFGPSSSQPGPVFPDAPVLISPGSSALPGETVRVAQNGSLEFRWTGVQGATRYGLYISKTPYGPANLVYMNEQVTGSSLTIPLSAFQQAGVSAYRWNMTAFNGPGDNDNGAFAPALNFMLEIAPGPPLAPDRLDATMSSTGRVFLAWPEVLSALRYEFSGTFDGQAVTIPDTVNARGTGVSGAVAAFASNPSAPDKLGKLLCLSVRALNAGGPSAWTPSSCVGYRYYALSTQRTDVEVGGRLPPLRMIWP